LKTKKSKSWCENYYNRGNSSAKTKNQPVRKNKFRTSLASTKTKTSATTNRGISGKKNNKLFHNLRKRIFYAVKEASTIIPDKATFICDMIFCPKCVIVASI
jgi:hypothetical protein